MYWHPNLKYYFPELNLLCEIIKKRLHYFEHIPYVFFKAFLANDDLGDSLDSVEALVKKHEDFEKSLAAQEEKVKALDEFATKLIQNEHYAADEVSSRREAVSIQKEIVHHGTP